VAVGTTVVLQLKLPILLVVTVDSLLVPMPITLTVVEVVVALQEDASTGKSPFRYFTSTDANIFTVARRGALRPLRLVSYNIADCLLDTRRWIAPTQPCLVNSLALADVVSNKATALLIVQMLHPNSATTVRSQVCTTQIFNPTI